MSLSKNSKIDRILAVDDTKDNLILVQTILESEGYDIYLVADGVRALQQVAADPPDLILLDVMLPGMDGYEVTRRIRNNQDIGYIPILLITAFHESSVVEGLDAGADDFICKPFDTDELLARVRSLLRLKHSIDEQRKMTRQRQDFVSRLTHDLRNPLRAANNMLDLFTQEIFCPISQEMKEAINVMIRSNENLMQMVNNLLEVSQIETEGEQVLNWQDCDVLQIIQEVVKELTPLAAHKHLTLKIDHHHLDPLEEKSAVVRGDSLKLRRVWQNLIGNAIKFTDSGGIEIRIFPSSANPKDGITIEVADTGYGIDIEDQAIIFERFRQGRNKRFGSGLGLHLSDLILKAHGGTIAVKSERNKGSVFTITLPRNT